MRERGLIFGTLLVFSAGGMGHAAVVIDTSVGSGPPPATVGGYAMVGFPADVRSPGTWVANAVPPPPVAGSLLFSEQVEIYKVGPGVGEWNGWSHGYSGPVYFSPWTGAGGSTFAQLELTMPPGMLAFYLYLEPEVAAASWDFEVSGTSAGGSSVTQALLIAGGGGARCIGFATDDPSDALATVFIRQTSEEFLGFGLGEFGLSVPEPAAGAGMVGLALLGAAGCARRRQDPDPTR